MTDTPTTPEPGDLATSNAARDAARRHIITNVNNGLSIQAAVNAAIAEGLDDIACHAAGRSLRDDMFALKKRRNLRDMRYAALMSVAGVVLFLVRAITHIHYGLRTAVVLVFAGLAIAIVSLFKYMTTRG